MLRYGAPVPSRAGGSCPPGLDPSAQSQRLNHRSPLVGMASGSAAGNGSEPLSDSGIGVGANGGGNAYAG
jgi:hypothetical protein